MSLGIGYRTAIAGMLGHDIIAAQLLGGGRNSRVYKVICENGSSYAAKLYFLNASDKQSRLQREFSALKFLADNGVRCLPRPIACDVKNSCTICEYIDADVISVQEVDGEYIRQVVEFVRTLKEVGEQVGQEYRYDASEACFSLSELERNIRQRLQRLVALTAGDKNVVQLQRFLGEEFEPILNEHAWDLDAQSQFAASGPVLAKGERVLSPSDLGFHNALKRSDGRIAFVDFEHFGWDDPAKLVSDFILHPHESMAFRDSLKKLFFEQIVDCFGEQRDALIRRIKAVYPLYALKWATILLNEFIPAHWSRREFSGQTGETSRDAVLSRQLEKARTMLSMSRNTGECLPFWS